MMKTLSLSPLNGDRATGAGIVTPGGPARP